MVKFQFQTGAIKSVGQFYREAFSIPRFNSKLVRLKVWGYFTYLPDDSKFQFQTGAIKRQELINWLDTVTLFQFQTGAIKRRYRGGKQHNLQPVSIPNWCD